MNSQGNPIDLVTVRLTWVEEDVGPPAPHLLRGALSARFRDNPLFHQHEDERLLYRYPRIQYRWDRRGATILGMGEGIQALTEIDWASLTLRVGEKFVNVREAICEFSRHAVGPSKRLIRYRFVAPWLPLNQKNFQRYQAMSPGEQVEERDRLAVAGLLIALRGFGIDFREHLYAGVEDARPRTCRYKDLDMLGFTGRLLANVELPDGFAIGRANSHGYGWIERLTCSSQPREVTS